MNVRNVTFALMSLQVCLWGLDYIIAKAALELVSPLNLLFLKYLIGMTLLFFLKLKIDRSFGIRKKDIPLVLTSSISGEILYNFCEYSAMDYISVSSITIILAFVPVVSILIERVIYKQKFNGKILLGVVICIIGVAIVLGADFRALFQGRAMGYVFAFGAVFAWNIYNFVTSKVGEHYSSLSLTFNQLLCTTLLVLPYAVHTMPPAETFTPEVIWGILYLGIGSAGLGYLIEVRGLQVLGPTIAAVFSNFVPVTATFFGWLLLGETASPLQLAGGIIVIASSCVVIIEKGKQSQNSGKPLSNEKAS